MVKEYSQLLDNQEISWIVQAFLRSPERLEKGATEEEILQVIKWAEDLKLEVVLKFGILYQIYRGALTLSIKDADVMMALAKDVPEDIPPDRENARITLVSSVLRLM